MIEHHENKITLFFSLYHLMLKPWLVNAPEREQTEFRKAS